MGQAWCKEKTSKAQDSKSPLDRVFVRCAHRIYPGLKEEGSVLGGATQRVTSSEIGYAGSPPRDVLARGRSIDSVDRPFQPSDWVDVNLEVTGTPRTSSVLTNLIVDGNLYPPTSTTTSIGSDNATKVRPVPPPRRKKRNRGRPLPPKPDEIPEKTSCIPRHVDANDEPLYTSVLSNSPKMLLDDYTTADEVVGGCSEFQQRRHDTPALSCTTTATTATTATTNETRETRSEHSKGGMPEGGRTREIYEHKVNGTGRIISSDVVSGKRTNYNGGKNSKISYQHRKIEEVDDYERFAGGRSIKDSSTPNRRNEDISSGRSKEMPVSPQVDASSRNNGKHEVKVRPKNYSTVSLPNYDELDIDRNATKGIKDERSGGEKIRSRRPVRSSTGSLPVEHFLLPFSEKTTVRLEDYIPRRASIESLSTYQEILGKLDCTVANGVDEGEFLKYDPDKLEVWDPSDIGNCELNHQRRLDEIPQIEEIEIYPRIDSVDDRDEVDISQTVLFDRYSVPPRDKEELQKPMSFGKMVESVHDDSKFFSSTDKSLRVEDRYKEEEASNLGISKPDQPPSCNEPFFLNQNNPFYSDTIDSGRSRGSDEEDFNRSNPSRIICGRSLSKESEPCNLYDVSCETKELYSNGKGTTKIIRTISKESLERAMSSEEKEAFCEGESLKILETNTPPPSPEGKIKPEILDNEHSTLLKNLKEEAAEGSNFSSMTPSLTELEVALSDMLEKEQTDRRDVKKEETKSPNESLSHGELAETKMVSVERGEPAMPLEGILRPKTSPIIHRKVSFCTWEEKKAFNDENTLTSDKAYEASLEESNELDRCSPDDSIAEKFEDTPTPPRRRHRPSYPSGILRRDHRTATNCSDSEQDDRLV